MISSHGYVKIYLGRNHPGADSKGYVYEHRYIMEQVIGRELEHKEIVHHRDKDKKNNIPENLMIVISNGGHCFYHRKNNALRKPGEPNLLLNCLCGCGGSFNKFDSSGRPRKYIPGHNMIRRENHGRYEN